MSLLPTPTVAAVAADPAAAAQLALQLGDCGPGGRVFRTRGPVEQRSGSRQQRRWEPLERLERQHRARGSRLRRQGAREQLIDMPPGRSGCLGDPYTARAEAVGKPFEVGQQPLAKTVPLEVEVAIGWIA